MLITKWKPYLLMLFAVFQDGYDSQHIRYKWEVSEASGKKSSSSDIRATSNYVLKKTEFFSNMNQYFAGKIGQN